MKQRKFLLLGYCVPFAFLALYMDEAFGSVWGYALLFGAAVLYGWLCGRAEAAFLWGNALSAVVSAVCTWMVYGNRMDGYFKPFGALGWAVMLCAASMVIQWLVKKRQWLVLGLASGAAGLLLTMMYSLQRSL